jgi:tRNA-dihydrouridine synthase
VLTFLETGLLEPEPDPQERLEMARLHARMLAVQECGPDAGPEARLPGCVRSQIVHYLKGIPGAAATRGRLVRVETLADIEEAIRGMQRSLSTENLAGVIAPPPSGSRLTIAARDGILTPN